MNVPLPGLKQPVGLGEIVSNVVHALFGIEPCPVCQQRAGVLSKIVTFTPTGANKQ